MLETIPGTARGLGSSRGYLGQEKHRERPETVRRNTERGNTEINRTDYSLEQWASGVTERVSSQRDSETGRKLAIWTGMWSEAMSLLLLAHVIGAFMLPTSWSNQSFQSYRYGSSDFITCIKILFLRVHLWEYIHKDTWNNPVVNKEMFFQFRKYKSET